MPPKIPSDDIDDSNIVKDVHISSKTSSIIEYILASSYTLILDEDHASYGVLVK